MPKRESGIVVALVCHHHGAAPNKIFAIIGGKPGWHYYDVIRPAHPNEKRSGRVTLCDAAFIPPEQLPPAVRQRLPQL